MYVMTLMGAQKIFCAKVYFVGDLDGGIGEQKTVEQRLNCSVNSRALQVSQSSNYLQIFSNSPQN